MRFIICRGKEILLFHFLNNIKDNFCIILLKKILEIKFFLNAVFNIYDNWMSFFYFLRKTDIQIFHKLPITFE